ncbi:MAG: tetratricopeptide repeat protein [Elusimicrobia bacterium]|nr:tetratricopeptide repeat protein [Elusimicrobiota bacterium]
MPNMFTENYKAGFGQITNYYRPFQILSYAIIVHAFGIKPWPFHFLNLLFHGLAGVFIFLLIMRLLPSIRPWLAAMAALLWVVHPIHVEEISIPSGVASPMHAFWLLFGLWSFVRYLDRRSFLWYGLTAAAYLSGILSKESAIVLPALLLAFHLTLIRLETAPKLSAKSLAGAHLPFWVLGGLYVLMRLTILNFGGTLDFYSQPNEFTQNFLYRLYTFFTVIGFGFKILFFPISLHPERSWPVYTSLFSWHVLISLAAVAAVIAAGIWSWKKEPRVSLGVFWFFASYSPMSNLMAKINALVWEHWFYTPSIGLIIALAAVAAAVSKLKKPFFILAPALIVIFGGQTFYRNRYWKDSEAYFRYILKYEPTTAKLWNNLAMAVSQRGDEKQAIEYYKEAIRLSDNYPETHHNLANAYLSLGMIAPAKEEFTKAIAMNPRFYHSYLSLANIALAENNAKEAVVNLEAALAVYPYLTQARQVLETLKAKELQKNKNF